jgi:MFS family permease
MHDTVRLLSPVVGSDDARRISTLLGLMFGVAGMGSSSAAIALPALGADLGVSVGVATWTISLYALFLGVTTAVHGRLSDLVGVRGPMVVGVSLMAGGAIVAALAPTFGVLLAARVVQGAGAAAVPTLGVAVVNSRYGGELRGLALGRFAATAAAVSCLGPLIGGVVEHWWGWRAVMALPVLGALVLPLVWRALTGDGSGARLDVIGAVLVTATAGGLVLLVQSPSTGATVAVVGLLLFGVGVPLVAASVRRRPDGFLPAEVVRNGTVVRGSLAAAAVPAAWFAHLIAVPAVMIHEGWEPWEVGLLLVPSAALAMAMPRTAGRVLARIGPTRSLAASAVIASGALLVVAAGTEVVSPPLLVLAVALVCVAFGLGQPALMAAVGDAVRSEVRGVAVGVATLTFLVGGSVGSAVVGGLGDAVSIPLSLLVLAALPLLALAVLVPDLLSEDRAAAQPEPAVVDR